MSLSVHFSSKNHEWTTPDDLFNKLDSVFHFDLDAAASSDNTKCKRFFTERDDALLQRWEGNVWLNPPYGRQIEAFMRKAYESSLKGATVVCLVPARTDTRWWARYAERGLVVFLRGRLKFGGAAHAAPFPSALVIFFGGDLGGATRPAPLKPSSPSLSGHARLSVVSPGRMR